VDGPHDVPELAQCLFGLVLRILEKLVTSLQVVAICPFRQAATVVALGSREPVHLATRHVPVAAIRNTGMKMYEPKALAAANRRWHC